MRTNVGHILQDRAARDPSRPAVVVANGEVSYAELHDRARAMAAQLRAAGLQPGDRVALFLDNGVELAAAWFGVLYAGCATVPVAAYATAHELGFRLEHAKCAAVITTGERSGVVHEAKRLARSSARMIDADDEGDPGQSVEPAALELDDDAVAMILYTSGTTGAAKGVCISHRSLLAHTEALVADTLRLTEDDRVLGTLPLTHSYGIRMTLLVPFAAGAPTFFVPRFDPTETLRLCEEHQITWLPAVPTMFNAWANDTSQNRPTSLRWCLSAGAPLTESTRVAAEARLRTSIRQGYGLTEATFTAVNAPPDDIVPGSVGRPVKGVDVRIAPDGEVLVRGQNVMLGYLDDATATKHIMRDGWLHTGDLGSIDERGNLVIVDRSKDIILRGGHTIYPSEVEQVLASHEAIESVAVVGRPDPHYGEEIVACIVASRELEPSEVDRWARTYLSATKVPRQVAFLSRLPVGGSGKVLKRRLREELERGELEAQNLRPAQ